MKPIITSKTPKLDLHGEVTSMVECLVNDFIKDNVNLHNEAVIIIHGKSTNILTKEVDSVLKKNEYVESFKRNNWNLGETIVFLKR